MLLAAALLAGAQVRVTEAELKLVGDTPPGVAREGPSWDPAGYLYFVGNNKVSRMDSQNNVEPFLDPAPGANGSLVDPQGRTIVCESQSRRVIRIERDRSHVLKILECAEGSRFSMMDIEDERNHMGAAVGLCYRIGQSGTSAAE